MGDPLKYQSDSIYDDGLNYAITNATHIVACEGMPADYTAASTLKGSGGNQLGEKTVTLTGPSAGDTDGRKLTVPAVVGIAVDVTGVMDFQAVIDDTGNELLLVSPMPKSSITGIDTGTNTVTIDGDHTGDIGTDDDVTIRNSTGNNGTYTVSSVSLNGSDTDVVTNESIGDATVDGSMIYGAVKLSDTGEVNTGEFDKEIGDVD